MKLTTLNFENNPNIGLFAVATDGFCLTGKFIRDKDAELMASVLKVPVHKLSVLRTGFLGIFCAGNSRGVVVSDKLHDDEIAELKKKTQVLVLDSKQTAIGNILLANDRGCIISKELEPLRNQISKFLGVETRVGTIAGLDLVGSLAVANSNGCLVHKAITEKEKALIEKTLGVSLMQSSINFGNQWIRSGLVANSNGFVAGDQTSGPELGLISETLGFL
ncbi:MAG: translation initiation factor IF-6 [Candidatus Aenigmarchaeota archaeon]|nr:translation initiation factor IF-6 [Candidatus Aenigmarchaeota archaeon]